MNRQYLFLVVASFGFVFGQTSIAAADDVYVTVREAKLRTKQDFFSPGIADVRYGDKLNVLNESGSWLSVKTGGGKQGFIHQSAITERRVVLKGSAKFDPNQTSQSDVVLAGKGFNADVERRFAAAQHVNFADVNAMEKIKISPNELSSFVAQGKLGRTEG